MTSQNPVTSKSHTFQDHHGDVRSRLSSRARRECRVGGPFPVSWHFPDCSPAFPCLTVSFFLSFEIERFQFPFFVSLLFLFVLVHGHFCSVVVGFSISQPPFPSSQCVVPSEKYTSMTSVDCRVISSLHVQFEEMKVRLWHSLICQNTSVRRLQVCFRGGSAAGGQQANSSSIPRRWRTRSWNPRSRMKTTRSSAPSLPIWKVTSS